MGRPLRIEYPGAVYHVLNRGAARQKVFRGAVDYQRFLEGLAEAHTRWGVELFAFCLMGTYSHLCLRTPGGNLGRIKYGGNVVRYQKQQKHLPESLQLLRDKAVRGRRGRGR